MKKVFFVIDSLAIGGSEYSLLENCKNFTEIKPIVVYLFKNHSLREEFTNAGIDIYYLEVNPSFYLIDGYFKLRNLVKIQKPDIIVSSLTKSDFISRFVCLVSSIKCVGTFVSDLYSKEYNLNLKFKARIKLMILYVVNRLTSFIPSAFISNSESSKISNSRLLGINLNKVRVIHRGRDFSKINTKVTFRDKPQKWIIVGRLQPVKGHEFLLRSLHEFLSNTNLEITLDIYGDGPLKDKISNLISELYLDKKVFLKGFNLDVSKIYCEYDLLISSSFSEGFSGTLIEASFAKLPMLVSNIDSNLEIVQNNITGWTFESQNMVDFLNKMEYVYNNYEAGSNYANNAYENAIAKYSIIKNAKTYQDFLLSLV